MTYKKAQELAMLTPNTQIVTVANCEGDLHDLYHEPFTRMQKSSAY